jgi:FixJ family two-component response regulator
VQARATKRQSQSTEHRPVVAVVDDDPAVCNSLEFSLPLEGFSVRAYGGAAELFEAGDLAAFDCFVIDQRMAGLSGMELIATLRRRKILTPAILLISHPNVALSARAAKDAIPIVEKPLLGNTLVERIRAACERNRP